MFLGGVATVASVVPSAISINSYNSESVTSHETSQGSSLVPETLPDNTKGESGRLDTESSYSIPTTPAEKQRERYLYPELCKEVLSMNQDVAKLKVCRLHRESKDIEFEYHYNQSSIPIPIKDLRFTPSQLVVTLSKSDIYNSSTKRFDLTHDIIGGQGIISQSQVSDKVFTEKQCKLEWQESTIGLENRDWKVIC